MFKSQVERCWRKPIGHDATVEVGFTITLTRAGWLLEPPVPERPATSDYAMAYQNSAIKALNECQPYKLPIQQYDEWKHFVPVFSERKSKAADRLLFGLTPSICRGC